LVEVQEEERKRLALDLHDDPLQRAVLLTRRLKSTSETGSADPGRQDAANQVAVSLRAICTGLPPPMLDDFGLASALDCLANSVRIHSDLSVAFHHTATEDEAPLDAGLQLALLRVAQQALNNVMKHARAEHADIYLDRDLRCVRIHVVDDGVGIAHASNSAGRTSLGLLGMRERLAPWSGSVDVEPGPGGGTVVTAEVPPDGAIATAPLFSA